MSSKRRGTPKDALDKLNPKTEMKATPPHDDGTLEDQVDIALETTSKVAFEMQELQNTVHTLQHEVEIARSQNLVMIDILSIVLEMPFQAFDMGYDNVLAFNRNVNPDPTTHILSRQAALKRKLTKAGVIVDG